jgi:hypothetical protein
MPEVAFLDAVRFYLAGPAGLSPAPGTVGFGVPVQGNTLPLIALSLSQVGRLSIGLGGGLTEVAQGSLPVTATIDLANPVLPGADPLVLLDPSRRLLTLPHGGLIRADALDGSLGPTDITVTVGGVARTLTAGVPGPTRFAVDPMAGVLAFGAALPATGNLVATYHLGIWERETTLITGSLDLGVWDTDLARLGTVSAAAVRAMLRGPGGALPGLRKIALGSFGEVAAPQTAQPQARQRQARFAFEFEHVADAPSSSGGIIQRIPITSRLAAFVRDPATGALVYTIAEETET